MSKYLEILIVDIKMQEPATGGLDMVLSKIP